ncbi:hypothetical protein C1X65_13305 [Pseudomonas sp. FW305-70]|nr:hypothetical protein C1X65_13305 [Pseudomonas sp. FW305-70]
MSTDTLLSRASPLPQRCVGMSICDILQTRFCLYLRLAADRRSLRLPKRAILVGQSLPPAFHPAEANLSCPPICVVFSVH